MKHWTLQFSWKLIVYDLRCTSTSFTTKRPWPPPQKLLFKEALACEASLGFFAGVWAGVFSMSFTNKRVSCWAQYLAPVAMPFPQSDSNDTHTWQELVNEQLRWSCSTTCGASWLVDWIRTWSKCLVFSHWRVIFNHWLASPEMWGRKIRHEEKTNCLGPWSHGQTS